MGLIKTSGAFFPNIMFPEKISCSAHDGKVCSLNSETSCDSNNYSSCFPTATFAVLMIRLLLLHFLLATQRHLMLVLYIKL